MPLRKRLWLISVVFVTCIFIDQITKGIALQNLVLNESWSYLGDSFRFQLAYNDGALLNLGSTLPPIFRFFVFNIAVAAMLVVILAYAIHAKHISWLTVLAMACYAAGGTSNLIDRIVTGGYVIDFMNLGIGSLRTGVFNVADMYITTGAILFLLQLLIDWRSKRRSNL
jgi:signal peptidase II